MLSLHRVYTEPFRVYTESTQSQRELYRVYTEQFRAKETIQSLCRIYTQCNAVLQELTIKNLSNIWWISFTFPNNIHFFLSVYTFNHHPQQFTSKDVPPSLLSSSSTIHFSTTLRLQLVSYLRPWGYETCVFPLSRSASSYQIMKSTVLDCRVCNPKVRITNPIIGITYPILVIGSTQSLHRAIQSLYRIYTE